MKILKFSPIQFKITESNIREYNKLL